MKNADPTQLFSQEVFTSSEEDILRRYFTNIQGPVFALVNLPEVVKSALFARYSRSHKSLRRLFLDEFVGDLDITADSEIDATAGLARAEQLYQKVFFEYGDDSVAQLGGAHLACEQVSNVLSKVIEWGRLMSYLEQSTRYLDFADRTAGRYRYYRPPELLMSPLGTRYVGEMDKTFTEYGELWKHMNTYLRAEFPKSGADSDFVYLQAIKAKVCDSLRGMLPAATLTNVGIYGNGQAFEYLLLRMRAHPLAESRNYAEMMLEELRKAIPSFLRRVDVEDRGMAWSAYLSDTRESMEATADHLFGIDNQTGVSNSNQVPAQVRLVDFNPDGEKDFLTAALFPYSQKTMQELTAEIDTMGADDKLALARSYMGERRNRRHRPGRALELPVYRFEVLCDYGAFRDLQRHRMLTIEWQQLGCDHGYAMPEHVAAAGAENTFRRTMERSASLYEDIMEVAPAEASYAVSLAYNIRFYMQMNAREAMHLTELRSMASGHESYRWIAQEMHRLIAEKAGHTIIAEMMKFVGKEHDRGLERLASERKSAQRQIG